MCPSAPGLPRGSRSFSLCGADRTNQTYFDRIDQSKIDVPQWTPKVTDLHPCDMQVRSRATLRMMQQTRCPRLPRMYNIQYY